MEAKSTTRRVSIVAVGQFKPDNQTAFTKEMMQPLSWTVFKEVVETRIEAMKANWAEVTDGGFWRLVGVNHF